MLIMWAKNIGKNIKTLSSKYSHKPLGHARKSVTDRESVTDTLKLASKDKFKKSRSNW